MPDLFGSDDHQKSTVPKNLSTQNDPLLPAEITKNPEYDFSSIRKVFHNGEWWFAYKDIVGVLADTKALDSYCRDLKKKLIAEGFQWCEKISVLKLTASDGKSYRTSCFSRADIFRLIESISSPKAEPCKQWISRLAHERLEEIENPDKGADNAIEGYRKQGKGDRWIEARLKGKVKFASTTDALKSHGAENYAILIDVQHKHAFDLSVKAHKALKGIEEKGSLRDGMNEWELFVQEAADTASKWLLDEQKAKGQSDCKKSMADGGDLASTLRASMERKLGREIIDNVDYRQITA